QTVSSTEEMAVDHHAPVHHHSAAESDSAQGGGAPQLGQEVGTRKQPRQGGGGAGGENSRANQVWQHWRLFKDPAHADNVAAFLWYIHNVGFNLVAQTFCQLPPVPDNEVPLLPRDDSSALCAP